MELKRIDFKKGSFQANGKTYYINSSLTIERYAELQIFQAEIGPGMEYEKIFKKLHDVYKLINKMQFADAAVYVNDLIRGFSKLEEKEPTILKICTLMCNTDDEDRTTYNNDLAVKKIEDWKREGIDMRDFFQLASGLVSGFLDVYKTATLIISEQKNEKAEGNQ